MFATFGISIFSLLLGLFIFGFAVFAFVFWIWMLIDAIQNRGLSEGEKIGWVLAIVFVHFLGALLYFFIGRPKRRGAMVT